MTTHTHWFFPCWSGDFRLEADTADTCILTVEDPTAADYEILNEVLGIARVKGWINPSLGIQPKGVSVLPLTASMREVAPYIAKEIHPEGDVWTILRHADGKVTLDEGLPAVDKVEQAVDVDAAPVDKPVDTAAVLAGNAWAYYESCEKCSAPEAVACTDLRSKAGKDLLKAHKGRVQNLPAAIVAPSVVAAATVKTPRQGCPAPTACERRASEVLRTFSTASQARSWARDGRMRVIGGVSGKSYDLFHRDVAAKRGMSTVLAEVRTGHEVCVWDDRVPPEEEALAIKMAIEHRESWLRGLPVRRL
jgi:hypothetical protein